MKVRHMDFYSDEWIGGTIGLSNADRGLYITACAMICSAGKAIKISDLFLACSDHGNSLKSQLDRLLEKGKLLRKGDEIDQKRVRKELQKARKRSTNGRENAEKRWGKPDDSARISNKNNDLRDGIALPRSITKPMPRGKPNHQPTNHQPLEEDLPRPDRAESPPCSPGSPSAGYAFEASIIRLKTKDFEAWQRAYHAYPDLASELQTIDAKLVDSGHVGPWVGKVSGWLKAGHERRMRARSAEKAPPSPEGEDLVLRSVLTAWVARGGRPADWPEGRGVPPGRPGCQIPQRLLAEFNLLPIAVGAAS